MSTKMRYPDLEPSLTIGEAIAKMATEAMQLSIDNEESARVNESLGVPRAKYLKCQFCNKAHKCPHWKKAEKPSPSPAPEIPFSESSGDRSAVEKIYAELHTAYKDKVRILEGRVKEVEAENEELRRDGIVTVLYDEGDGHIRDLVMKLDSLEGVFEDSAQSPTSDGHSLGTVTASDACKDVELPSVRGRGTQTEVTGKEKEGMMKVLGGILLGILVFVCVVSGGLYSLTLAQRVRDLEEVVQELLLII